MDAVNSVLKGVTFNGLGSTSKLDGRDQGAKTGTTETNDNVWLVSYTPEIAASVMIAADVNVDFVPFWDAHGNNNGISDQSDRDMRGVPMPSGRVLQGWSWLDPPLVFNPALQAVIGALPATAFTAPTAEILKGTPATPPRCGGDYNSMVACFEAAGYSTARMEVFNEAKAGTFISSSCDYYLGGLCSLIYSKGPKPEPPSTTPSAQPTP
jgi:membrane peptidoglycan carboxypeptidase